MQLTEGEKLEVDRMLICHLIHTCLCMDQKFWVLDSQCSAKLQFSKSLSFSETLEKASDLLASINQLSYFFHIIMLYTSV